jgi:hypothetical protein
MIDFHYLMSSTAYFSNWEDRYEFFRLVDVQLAEMYKRFITTNNASPKAFFEEAESRIKILNSPLGKAMK